MEIQIQYLLLLQHFRESTNGFFDGFFMAATWFGELLIPLAFTAVIYWAVNKRAGVFLFFNFGLTLFVNVFLKMTACIKRPWLIDSRISPVEKALPAANGYSFPSGHTAGAMCVWGGTAFWWWHNKIIRYAMIFLVLLVGFSRNYVGVHTPQDVIVSIIAGIGIIFFADWILKWIEEKPNRDILFFIIMTVLGALLYLYIHLKCCMQMQSYNSLTDLVNPLEMKHGVYPKIGFMQGIFTGWILERKFVKFDIAPFFNTKKIVFAVFGLVLLYLMMFFMNKYLVLIMSKQIASAIIGFVTALFVTFLYPLILKFTANR